MGVAYGEEDCLFLMAVAIYSFDLGFERRKFVKQKKISERKCT